MNKPGFYNKMKKKQLLVTAIIKGPLDRRNQRINETR